MTTENSQAAELQQQLRISLRTLSQERHRLKFYYNLLFSIALGSGASATIIAALASGSRGKFMLGSGTQGWQLTCGIIALLTLMSTIANSMQQNVWIKDRFWKIEDSYGILKSLLKEMEFEPNQYLAVRRDYQRLVQRHPDLLN